MEISNAYSNVLELEGLLLLLKTEIVDNYKVDRLFDRLFDKIEEINADIIAKKMPLLTRLLMLMRLILFAMGHQINAIVVGWNAFPKKRIIRPMPLPLHQIAIVLLPTALCLRSRRMQIVMSWILMLLTRKIRTIMSHLRI